MQYYQISIDSRQRCIFVRHDEKIEINDIKQLMEDIAGHPDYNLAENLVIDTRECEFLLSEDDIYNAALFTKSVLKQAKTSKTAMIVDNRLAHGLGRMFSIYSKWEEHDFEIFSTTEEVKGWLGIPREYIIEILAHRR